MGKIYCLMGKSASGKDSIYKKILEKAPGRFKTIVSYTTRPIRSGETEGVEYHFVSVPEFKAMDEADKLPKNLKRGVLSEDGIYNVLERNKELLKILEEFDD